VTLLTAGEKLPAEENRALVRVGHLFLRGDWACQEIEPGLLMPCIGCIRLLYLDPIRCENAASMAGCGGTAPSAAVPTYPAGRLHEQFPSELKSLGDEAIPQSASLGARLWNAFVPWKASMAPQL
jgi:hypothetical protein